MRTPVARLPAKSRHMLNWPQSGAGMSVQTTPSGQPHHTMQCMKELWSRGVTIHVTNSDSMAPKCILCILDWAITCHQNEASLTVAQAVQNLPYLTHIGVVPNQFSVYTVVVMFFISDGEWPPVLQSCSGLLFFGSERFLSHLPSARLTSFSLPGISVLMILQYRVAQHSGDGAK